jgi:hypothetical protein
MLELQKMIADPSNEYSADCPDPDDPPHWRKYLAVNFIPYVPYVAAPARIKGQFDRGGAKEWRT